MILIRCLSRFLFTLSLLLNVEDKLDAPMLFCFLGQLALETSLCKNSPQLLVLLCASHECPSLVAADPPRLSSSCHEPVKRVEVAVDRESIHRLAVDGTRRQADEQQRPHLPRLLNFKQPEVIHASVVEGVRPRLEAVLVQGSLRVLDRNRRPLSAVLPLVGDVLHCRQWQPVAPGHQRKHRLWSSVLRLSVVLPHQQLRQRLF